MSRYKELAGKLAQGLNFPDNAVVLAVGVVEDGGIADGTAVLKGDTRLILPMLKELTKKALEDLHDEEARFARDYLLTAFAEDEQRRRNGEGK